MDNTPELVYAGYEEAIYVEYNGTKTQLYSNATRDEFAVISDIDKLVTSASSLSDQLIETLSRREDLIQQKQYFATLNAFQNDAAKYYRECQQFQSTAENSDSDIVQAQLGQLYKLDKFLQHYFRQLSVAQSLGYSERLLFTYLSTRDHVFLYGFVRNACSTLEYLGKLLESRRGKGKLGLGEERHTFKRVYRELQQQGLDETFAQNEKVTIPKQEEQMKMGEVGLDDSEMDFLWEKRNEIVHHCPVVAESETVEHLPDDLLTAVVLTQPNIAKLTRLAARVHLHSVGIFLKFSASYMLDLITQLVDAWYHENPTES